MGACGKDRGVSSGTSAFSVVLVTNLALLSDGSVFSFYSCLFCTLRALEVFDKSDHFKFELSFLFYNCVSTHSGNAVVQFFVDKGILKILLFHRLRLLANVFPIAIM